MEWALWSVKCRSLRAYRRLAQDSEVKVVSLLNCQSSTIVLLNFHFPEFIVIPLVEEHLERKNQKVVVSITPGPIETKYSQETSCFFFLKFYRNVLLVCISLALSGLAGGISFAPIMPDLIRKARYAFVCYS